MNNKNHHKQIPTQKINRKLTKQGWKIAEVKVPLENEEQEPLKGHASETIWFACHMQLLLLKALLPRVPLPLVQDPDWQGS